jgi:pimeloyl-ACP methyl ester carboxylesterase
MTRTEPPGRGQRSRRLTGFAGLLGALRNLGWLGPAPARAGEFAAFAAEDGQSIPVRVLGRGSPIVLVHGLGCSHRQWLPVARRLARRHRAFAWDCRGHGRCRPVAGVITLARLGRDLGKLLEHFELPRAVLVGHSMGALAVMQYLHDHGTAGVAAVVLVDQSPRVVSDEQWPLGLFGSCSASMLQGLIAGARVDLAGTLAAEVEAVAGERLRPYLRADAALGRWLRRWLGRVEAAPLLDLAESLVAADFRHSLQRLDAPLLVVLGGRSAHYGGLPLDAWYRQAVPHAQVRIYPQAGHSPHYSEPARFADDLLQFIADHA